MNNYTPEELSISPRLMYEEAMKRNIKCTLFPSPFLIQMEKNGSSWYVSGSRTSTQSSVGKTIADYKHLTKSVLTHHQIPTAPYQLVRKMEDIDRVDHLTFPVVGKPTVGNQGIGVVVGLQNKEEARAYAQDQFDTYLRREEECVLFEEILEGEEYRILCIDYTFVAASYRKPAHVIGDGVHTVQQLVDQKKPAPLAQARP